MCDSLSAQRDTSDVEIKSWIDFNDRFTKPKIARHLSALANNGGGYLVFGFNDDLTRDQNRPVSLEQYNRDYFSSIIKHYLLPTFQCDVLTVVNGLGEEIPIVRVPSHGSVPIGAKRDGPMDSNNRPSGIRSGTYYIRKPGPESAPILGAGEWLPLIRRCVLNERESLLQSFSDIVDLNKHSVNDTSDRLDRWHSESKGKFDGIVSACETNGWNIPITDNCYQLSYLISVEDKETLSVDSMRQILERVNGGVRDTIESGWSMFYQFHDIDIMPKFHPEQVDGSGSDVFEANLLAKMNDNLSFGLPDYWRVTPDGRATIVRLYLEDRPDVCVHRETDPRTWIGLNSLVGTVTEFVTHARLYAKEFASARSVQFKCTWNGLANRKLSDFDALVAFQLYGGLISQANTRTTAGEWSTSVLATEWAKVVSELLSPVLRLFGYETCSPQWIERVISNYRRT